MKPVRAIQKRTKEESDYDTYLATVAAQVAKVIKGVKVEHLDGVVVHRRKVLPASAEAAFATALDTKLAERPNIVDEKVHQAQLIREADKHTVARRMERNAMYFVGEGLFEFERAFDIVPDSDGAVQATGCYEWLAGADIHTGNGSRVEVGQQRLEARVLALHAQTRKYDKKEEKA